MIIYISSLIQGMSGIEKLAGFISAQRDPDLGIELIAFTHDDAYWARLEALMDSLTCPIAFHGPYVGTEATAAEGSKEHEIFFESYEKVIRLARDYAVSHIVYHTTQIAWEAETVETARLRSIENTQKIVAMGHAYGVHVLVENLAASAQAFSLFDNESYENLFAAHPDWDSVIDVGHAAINQMDVENFLLHYANRVKAYHFHNNNGLNNLHNSIDNGMIDYQKFAGLYKKYTPQTSITLEYEPHVRFNSQQLLDQVAWVRMNF